jgi:hypothetical protein
MSIPNAVPGSHVQWETGPCSEHAQYRHCSKVRSDRDISNRKCVSNVSGPGPRANCDISSQDIVVRIYDGSAPICILFMNVAPTVGVVGCPSKNVAELPRSLPAIGIRSVARPMAARLSAG